MVDRENGMERRKHPRSNTHFPVVVVGAHGQESLLDTQTMNLSEGGLQFITRSAVVEGELLKVIAGGREASALVLESRYVYGGYIVRCKFLDRG